MKAQRGPTSAFGRVGEIQMGNTSDQKQPPRNAQKDQQGQQGKPKDAGQKKDAEREPAPAKRAQDQQKR
jgi:hypothetical protein